MDNIRFQNRLRQVKKWLNASLLDAKSGSAALLISSSAIYPSSRDQEHPFRQNSDFLYLTGCEVQETALLVSTEFKRPFILGASRSKQKIVWEGPGVNLMRLASSLDAEFIETSNIEAEVLKKIKGIKSLYYSSEHSSISLSIAKKILCSPSHLRAALPKQLSHSDLILEPLRLLKDTEEVDSIVAANKTTNTALLCSLPFMEHGRTESALAATIDYTFKLQGAECGFSSIVATGRNAATLHHKPGTRKLRRGDLLLLDVGAKLNHYNADISRTICVGQKFSAVQKDIYEIVLAAQKAALNKVRSGVLAQVVYLAAVHELCVGLKDLKILTGSLTKIIDKKLYSPYFPHGIGHTLGLDVHDIGNLRSDTGVKLQEGMVITIEPGLYFQKPNKHVPACGVRIEDNILVQKKGCRILSDGFPKEVSEIENLVLGQ